MNNLTKKRKKKGFTLVELMAVVAIIAILAVVLVPTVKGYIERSKKTAVISQARSVISAIEIYNATASDEIKDTDIISSVVTTIDELNSKDVSKLGSNTTIAKVREINNLENPLERVEINGSGVFTGISEAQNQ